MTSPGTLTRKEIKDAINGVLDSGVAYGRIIIEEGRVIVLPPDDEEEPQGLRGVKWSKK